MSIVKVEQEELLMDQKFPHFHFIAENLTEDVDSADEAQQPCREALAAH